MRKVMVKKLFTFFVCLIVATTAQADVLGEYSFEGTLGDKIPVKLKFCVNGDETNLINVNTNPTYTLTNLTPEARPSPSSISTS